MGWIPWRYWNTVEFVELPVRLEGHEMTGMYGMTGTTGMSGKTGMSGTGKTGMSLEQLE